MLYSCAHMATVVSSISSASVCEYIAGYSYSLSVHCIFVHVRYFPPQSTYGAEYMYVILEVMYGCTLAHGKSLAYSRLLLTTAFFTSALDAVLLTPVLVCLCPCS